MIKDAWLTEAQEAINSLEDLETKLNLNFNSSAAESILVNIGVKLDRLESLLLNPPTRPILTNEDLDFRWKMLSDIQLRTRTLARSVSASLTCPNRPSNVPDIGSNDNTDRYNQDFMKTVYSQDQKELMKPLLFDDENRSQVEQNELSFMSMISLRKACSTFLLFLGLVALLFLVVLLCTTM
ncbi:uncharacterized protein LOC107492063 isoform X2 [Arachis duranensis]|uniref:Uncharacterized protein LOC107492063 isoform X2 n=1 Tax=Arachis duranensis TaxID=130453 RepID=A0A6P4DHT0_ARADU|nr:uncharacterized protein LOC107492063 isoform X2 [Arachis duranensis]XP_025603584.1 uncharacterized protein LOC112695451 isoform X1 [Arachis hypogaea]